MEVEAYAKFIDEAFLRPIRSVLIVDDDYPTFDEVLNAEIVVKDGQEPGRTKGWYANPERIKRVIDRFRGKDRPLLVDIHDGSNVTVGEDAEIAAHLHQSDLLVLDYSLDPANRGDGSRALSIVRGLTDSPHFNMVVVHTSEPLDGVFRDTLLSLLRPLGQCLSETERATANDFLFEAETAQEGIEARLIASIGDSQYMEARRRPSFARDAVRGVEPFGQFKVECDLVRWRGDARLVVLKRLLELADDRLAPKMTFPGELDVIWSAGAVRFIRTDSVFVAFSNKQDEDDLIDELKHALVASAPEPSRLFHAKLRAEMDEIGTIAQRTALENRFALAHWYNELLSADGARRKWLVASSVARHAEQLLAGILPGVQRFAERLVEAEGDGDTAALGKAYFGVDLANEAAKRRAEREHNAYVSSRPVTGWHLSTGQIFTLGDDYWICLSPACDMVPGQLSHEKQARLGNWLPFTAVRLVNVAADRVIDDVSSNRYLFLKGVDDVRTFCFNDPTRDTSAPAWYTMYAAALGSLSEDFRFRVALPTREAEGEGLVSATHDAVVVAQLRYEYALSLMHRIGGSQTRVGLDYAGG